MRALRFDGRPVAGTGAAEVLPGRLIVVEGADGSGRSTQILRLKERLEAEGWPVVDVGLRRSGLVGPEIERAKRGNVLGPTTRSLYYATDFADQLENRVLPALRAGFVVLADRYVYTLMARDVVRGASPDWLESLYGIALVPSAVFYLQVSPQALVERNFHRAPTLDYWESGMDLGLSRDWFGSFVRYQQRIEAEFLRMRERYEFAVIDGNRPVREIADDLAARTLAVLGE
ncbi:MAG TPA: thymidylate kinase [Planctomycetota bacterium]|nr:thymidylate kinase [Planctomycetota bacterium]